MGRSAKVERVEIAPVRGVLLRDLLVEGRYGAVAGREVAVVAVYRQVVKRLGGDRKLGRAEKWEFVGDAGEAVCALPSEIEIH